jgi:hypothetical protein
MDLVDLAASNLVQADRWYKGARVMPESNKRAGGST